MAQIGAAPHHLRVARTGAAGVAATPGRVLGAPPVARTIPRRCPPRCTGRIRWARTRPPAPYPSTVLGGVLGGKSPLPDVAAVLASGRQVVAPRIAAPAPVRHGPRTPTRPRSAAACPPTAVRDGVVPRDVHDRVVPRARRRRCPAPRAPSRSPRPPRTTTAYPPAGPRPAGAPPAGTPRTRRTTRSARPPSLAGGGGELREPRLLTACTSTPNADTFTSRTGPSPSDLLLSGSSAPMRNEPPGSSTMPSVAPRARRGGGATSTGLVRVPRVGEQQLSGGVSVMA